MEKADLLNGEGCSLNILCYDIRDLNGVRRIVHRDCKQYHRGNEVKILERDYWGENLSPRCLLIHDA